MDHNQRCHNPSRSPCSIYTDVNIGPPMLDEIRQAINCLKSKEAHDPDAITAELYKYGGTELVSRLHKLTCCIWEEEMVPQDCGGSIFFPVFKKGLTTKYSNYRRTALVWTAAKIFSLVLRNRFRIQRNVKTRPNEAGFYPDMGTIDQLFVLGKTLEHRAKRHKPTVSLYTDFITAFDSVLRDGIWKVIIENGVPGKIVRLILTYYQHTRSPIQFGGKHSSIFQTEFCVWKGCILSPSYHKSNPCYRRQLKNPLWSAWSHGVRVYQLKILNFIRTVTHRRDSWIQVPRLSRRTNRRIHVRNSIENCFSNWSLHPAKLLPMEP